MKKKTKVKTIISELRLIRENVKGHFLDENRASNCARHSSDVKGLVANINDAISLLSSARVTLEFLERK